MVDDNANLIDKMTGSLPVAAREALATLVRLADEAGQRLYLVGGPVRDLLLGVPTLDLDLAVEGNAIALARQAAVAMDACCVEHVTFGTATLKGEVFSLDLAMARSETYRHPGALPRVRAASIREDMGRRDFTMNAMAIAMTGPQRGDLFDHWGGQADLRAGLVRVLHEASFVDDATRILRAGRYEARFGFRLEERTLAWLRRDAHYLESISGARLRQEIARIVAESEPERALLRLHELGVLTAIQPSLAFDLHRAQAFAALRELMPEAVPGAYWPLLCWGLDEREAATLAERLHLTRTQARAVCALSRLHGLQDAVAEPGLRPSAIVKTLSPYPVTAVQALAAATRSTDVRERCLDHLRRWRYVKPSLNGGALQEMGVPSGRRVGEVLERLKVAKLNGEVRSRREEEQLVRSLLASGARRRSS